MCRSVTILCALAAVVFSSGCKRKKKNEAPQLELTQEKTAQEARNLAALCKAAIDVMGMPGVQDRLARMSEVAAPISADVTLLEGLQALEGPKRMGFVRALIEKYGMQEQCKGALPAFERGPPRSDAPPGGQAAGAGVAPQQLPGLVGEPSPAGPYGGVPAAPSPSGQQFNGAGNPAPPAATGPTAAPTGRGQPGSRGEPRGLRAP